MGKRHSRIGLIQTLSTVRDTLQDVGKTPTSSPTQRGGCITLPPSSTPSTIWYYLISLVHLILASARSSLQLAGSSTPCEVLSVVCSTPAYFPKLAARLHG